ncbi:MAG: AAA family ATPase [Actinomycetota bacterium]
MSGQILVLDREDELYQALVRACPNLDGDLTPSFQTAMAGSELAKGQIRVLVAGPSSLSPQGIRFLQRVREEHPHVVTLLVAPKNGSLHPDRDLLRIGASDLVQFPAASRTLRTALQRALDMAKGIEGVRPGGEGHRTAATTITITSPSGGCGKTFFATNLAYALAVTGRRVAIIDLDLQFGEVVTALRLRPQYTIADLTHASDNESLHSHFREFTVTHRSGLEVLAAPADLAEADRILSPDITKVLQVARDLYDYVIIDTPAAITEQVLAAFDLSERLIVLATVDVPSVKNLGLFLSTLERLKIPSEGVSLVLNKAEKDVGLSPEKIRRLFPQGFQGTLPYSREVSRSINVGRPVLDVAPRAEVSRALVKTLARILPVETSLEEINVDRRRAASRSWLTRLLHPKATPRSAAAASSGGVR